MMFSWFKSSVVLPDLSMIGVDIHSHLIAGIDDGSPNLDTSLTLIKALQALGFRKLYTTPHIMSDYFPNTNTEITAGLEKLKTVLNENAVSIEIGAAAEYFIDGVFEEKIRQKDLLLLPKQQVLVEMSFVDITPNLLNVIFELRTNGYYPILAHPERYLYMYDKLDIYEQAREMGCKLQMNLLSLHGYYGKPVKQFAIKLLEKKLIDYTGTDLHHERHAKALQMALSNKEFAKWVQKYPFQNIELSA